MRELFCYWGEREGEREREVERERWVERGRERERGRGRGREAESRLLLQDSGTRSWTPSSLLRSALAAALRTGHLLFLTVLTLLFLAHTHASPRVPLGTRDVADSLRKKKKSALPERK